MRKLLVSDLREGESFEIPFLAKTMKHLVMERTSDTCSTIRGMIRNTENDPWKYVQHYTISNSVAVKLCAPHKETAKKNKVAAKFVNPEAPRKRGRKPLDIILSIREGEFTMKDVMGDNNISQPLAYIRLQKLISDGHVKLVKRVKNNGGRGKPSCVYQKTG